MLELRNRPIGVFDSGVGGLTVVSAVLSALPHERIVDLGDTARVPYGNRSEKTVLRFSRNAARFLLRHHVKLVLIACNTASAAALSALVDELPVQVLGAVEPGATAAVQKTRNGVVGVLGTLATIRSEAYKRALLALDPTLKLHALPCPLLVPLVEEGFTDPDDPITLLVIERYLSALKHSAPDLDTLVLGCTHYPLLRPALQKVAARLFSQPIDLVDSARAMAQATTRLLEETNLLAGPPTEVGPNQAPSLDRLRCYLTDEARAAEIAARFLGFSLPHLELVDL